MHTATAVPFFSALLAVVTKGYVGMGVWCNANSRALGKSNGKRTAKS